MSSKFSDRMAIVASFSLALSCSTIDELQSRDGGRGLVDAARDALGLDGSDASDGAATGDSGRDASLPDAPPMGDSLLRDTVMFFNAMRCPTGWEPYNELTGRVVVATQMGAMGGEVQGVPLRDAEDRTHTHTINETFLVDAVSYVGIVGGGNSGVASADDPTLMVRSEPASAGLPFVQLLACRKSAEAIARVVPVPSGMMIYVAGASCPSGYSQPAMTAGRAAVATPTGGDNLAAVGASSDQLASRAHRHGVSAILRTTPHGIALASGCCGMGFGRNGEVTADAPSSEDDAALPSITLLQCQKN
jgi:hypothetical protein